MTAMRTYWQAAASVGALCLAAVTVNAGAQSVGAARAARDRAKADLVRAQEAFDRADEAYVKALGGAATDPKAASAPSSAPAPAVKPTVASVLPTWLYSSPHGRIVTFAMSGPGAEAVDPLDYRGRLIVDGEASAWSQHTSGVKNLVSTEAQTLAYEIQRNANGDADRPSWATICKGSLPTKNNVTVEVVVAKRTDCEVR